jgi:hypothetical protein
MITTATKVVVYYYFISGENLTDCRFYINYNCWEYPQSFVSVTVDLQTVLHTEFVGMFIGYFHTKCHMPCPSGVLVIAIKPKAN